MTEGIPRVNVPVIDRILLHLWEQDHQADHYLVSNDVTRPGISEVCALHPPNVSRAMRDLMSDGLVSEHMRTIRGKIAARRHGNLLTMVDQWPDQEF